jgi:ATP-binding cassette, subfamily B, bacterial
MAAKGPQVDRELRRERFPGLVVLRLLIPLVGYRRLLGIGVLMVIGAAIPSVLALSLGWLVSEVEAGTSLLWPLMTIGAAFLGSSVHAPIMEAIGNDLGSRFDTELRHGAMDAASSVAGISHLEDPRNADRLTAVEELMHGWLTFRSANGLIQSWTARLRGTIGGIILWNFAWWAPLLLFISYRLTRQFALYTGFLYLRRHVTNTQHLRRAGYMRNLMRSGTAAKEVRIFGLADWFVDRFTGMWRDGMKDIWQIRSNLPRMATPIFLFMAASMGLIMYQIGLSGTRGMSIASVIVYLQAVGVMGGFGSAGDPEWQMHFGAFRAKDAVRMVETVRTPTSDLRGELPAPDLSVGLRFEDVEFTYPGQETEVLSGVSFDVLAGTSLAIVGENGAGKTTTIKLLSRLYDPTAGRILVDGQELTSIDPRSWRRRIGVIFQDFIRYPLSAKENIGFGAWGSLDDQDGIHEAARLAGADGFVERFGWDAPLSRRFEGGVDLSGGEWQRIALARALFAVRTGAKLLILDEPTANLDVRAEAAIYERFLQMTEGITTILISHRFSTVRMADKIVVIEHGKVIEEGSHDELMELDGRYASMFRSQASAYTDDVSFEEALDA